MSRRRSTPWIQRWSRLLIAGIAALGALDTAYLTLLEFGFFKEAAFCPTSGAINCQAVLMSDYAKAFGVPLSLFGFLAYASIAVFALAPQLLKSPEKKELHSNLDNWSWLLIFAGATAMVVFSSYLLYLMAFQIKAFCIYCLASVVFSVSLFVLAIIGRAWEDLGQLFFTGIVVGMIALIGTLGVYASVNSSSGNTVSNPGQIPSFSGDPTPGVGWPITTTSGEAEIALAAHLKQTGAKMYGAYWCPHCHEQKLLLGQNAFKQIPYIECADPQIPQKQLDVCSQAGIQSYPSWVINGKLEPGVQTGDKLAELSGYQGPRNFKYSLSRR